MKFRPSKEEVRPSYIWQIGWIFENLVVLPLPNLTPPPNADLIWCKLKLLLTTTMITETRNPSYEPTGKGLGKGLAVFPTASQQQGVYVGKLKGEGLDMGRSDRHDKGIKEGERRVVTKGEGGEGKQGNAR